MRQIALAMFMLTSFNMEELDITQIDGVTRIRVLEDDTMCVLPDNKFNELCNLLDINTEEEMGVGVNEVDANDSYHSQTLGEAISDETNDQV